MKMKNILLSAVAASTLFAFGSQANNASASTWHKGVPKKVQGYWATSGKKSNLVSFQQTGVGSVPYFSSQYATWTNPIYKTIGKNKFIIRPSKNNSQNNSGRVYFKDDKYVVKYKNNHVSIKINPYTWNNMHRTTKPE